MTPERNTKIKKIAGRRQLDLTLVLENVHDPHNIGAIMRTCDAVGIPEIYIIITDERISSSDYLLGHSASSGSKKWVKVHIYKEIQKCFEDVRERFGRIVGTKLGESSQSLYKYSFLEPTALLFGNESTGLSDEAYEKVDSNMYVPMMGMVKSLNISVACAISLYECLRQRNEKGMYTLDNENSALKEAYLKLHGKSPNQISPKWNE